MEPVLLILFNHKFERNLPRLREIYSKRFDHLYFIVPFYNGNEQDVITVFEHSYRFQGYISQALQALKHKRYRHYIVIGDDLILHPEITQDNYNSFFGLGNDNGFIPSIFLLDEPMESRKHMRKTPYWEWTHNAVNFELQKRGIEVENELPSVSEASQVLLSHGYKFRSDLERKQLNTKFPHFTHLTRKENLKHNFFNFIDWAKYSVKYRVASKRKIKYPMVGSYSDLVVIPQSSINRFGHLCGVFAALDLFVEIAIPTALLLTCQKVIQEKDVSFKGVTFWEGNEREMFEKAFNRSLSTLFSNFPEDTLYIHPIKLSKWQ